MKAIWLKYRRTTFNSVLKEKEEKIWFSQRSPSRGFDNEGQTCIWSSRWRDCFAYFIVNTYTTKFTIITILNIQFSAINHIPSVGQPSPSSSFLVVLLELFSYCYKVIFKFHSLGIDLFPTSFKCDWHKVIYNILYV